MCNKIDHTVDPTRLLKPNLFSACAVQPFCCLGLTAVKCYIKNTGNRRFCGTVPSGTKNRGWANHPAFPTFSSYITKSVWPRKGSTSSKSLQLSIPSLSIPCYYYYFLGTLNLGKSHTQSISAIGF